MAITTYSELQTAIVDWTAGQVTASQAQDFIALAEAEMSRLIYGNDAEKRATASTTSGTARLSLPDDCRRVRSLRHTDTTGGRLDYLTPAMLDRLGTNGSGRPTIYTVEANALRFSPVPDGAYTLEVIYQQGVPALTDANTTSDALTRHPDAYLHGSLMQAYDFLMDENRAAKARQRFGQLLEEVVLENERTRFPGPLQRRSAYREVY